MDDGVDCSKGSIAGSLVQYAIVLVGSLSQLKWRDSLKKLIAGVSDDRSSSLDLTATQID